MENDIIYTAEPTLDEFVVTPNGSYVYTYKDYIKDLQLSNRAMHLRASRQKEEENHRLEALKSDFRNNIRSTMDQAGQITGKAGTLAAATALGLQVPGLLQYLKNFPAALYSTAVGKLLIGDWATKSWIPDILTYTTTGKDWNTTVADYTNTIPLLNKIPYDWRYEGANLINPAYLSTYRTILAPILKSGGPINYLKFFNN